MLHFLHVVGRSIEALFGLLCILTAIALYPDEEGRIQSKLEDFWIRIDDYTHTALSRNTLFLRSVAKLEARLLSGIFGNRLLSFQAISVSRGLSTFSIFIYLVYLISVSNLSAENAEQNLYPFFWIIVCALGMGLLGVLLPKPPIARAIAIIAAGLLTYFSIVQFAHAPQARDVEWHIVAAGIVSFTCDIGFIVLTRKLVDRLAQFASFVAILLVASANFALAMLLLSPLLFIDVALEDASLAMLLIGVANIIDAAIAALFFILSAVLLLHRAFWPFLSRILYRMQAIDTKGRRAILTAVGSALLSASIFGGKVPDLIRDLVKSLGG